MTDILRYRTSQIGPALKEQGRKQRWLAEQLGVHESIVSDWVNGRRTVDHLRAKQIARVLDIPFYLLFNDTFVSDSVTGVAA